MTFLDLFKNTVMAGSITDFYLKNHSILLFLQK
jgi:hypothetical protein